MGRGPVSDSTDGAAFRRRHKRAKYDVALFSSALPRSRRLLPMTKSGPARERIEADEPARVLFEPLEPRYLLSADISPLLVLRGSVEPGVVLRPRYRSSTPCSEGNLP